MRRWQLTGLVVGAAALLFTAGPAQAQVWIGPPPVGPPPFGPPPFGPPFGPPGPGVITTLPGVIAPGPGVVTTLPGVVSPGWGARPYWGARRAYRPRGWYGVARGPRGGVVAVGRRW